MHQQAYDALGQMLKRSGIGLHAQWKVLDMGGRDVNSTAQGLDTRAWLPAANWTGADITPGPGVGIVTDATARPWKHDTTFDLAVCTEMLEHVQHWPEVAANLADAVRDGQLGQVFITCAGPGRPEHDSGGLPHLPEGQGTPTSKNSTSTPCCGNCSAKSTRIQPRHLRRLRMGPPAQMNFTAHNIVFADGTCTRPGHPPLESGGIFQAALRTLKLFTNPGATVADLGCLEGGYTAGFARAGDHTTGIEARTPNMAKCEHVADRLNLPNLRFTRADVRDLNEPYDAVFACGILYHLDEPVIFLHRLGESPPCSSCKPTSHLIPAT